MSVEAFGAGKVILLGEHAVVYGEPALAAALDVGVRATGVRAAKTQLLLPRALSGAKRQTTLKAFAAAAEISGFPPVAISVQSELPLSMGLGSSAAFSVAVSRVLSQTSEKASLLKDMVFAMERVFHHAPSGLDHTTSMAETVLRFQRKGTRAVFQKVKPSKGFALAVACLGPRRQTALSVQALGLRKARYPKRYDRLFRAIGLLADEGVAAVEKGDLLGLGDAMNVNQGLLSALQVSSLPIDDMVHRFRAMGAWGAKLTGAGGDGGAVIALFEDSDWAVRKLRRAGVNAFVAHVRGPE